MLIRQKRVDKPRPNMVVGLSNGWIMDDHGDIKSTVASAIPAQYRMRPWLKDWPLFCALWVAGYEFFKAGSDCSQAVDIRSMVAGMQVMCSLLAEGPEIGPVLCLDQGDRYSHRGSTIYI